ncbi:sigma-70 family RNA polymerase sigma factor [Candidatus Woesearchaeota archaeon]|nr:sigma-70 family RNA polymerase sigma factor [Candidatus Woesearchaeota archaeon]
MNGLYADRPTAVSLQRKQHLNIPHHELSDLLKTYVDGGRADALLRECIIRSHFQFVIAIAKRFDNGDDSFFGELLAEGNTGLLRALSTFDPSRGLRFNTYAHFWVYTRVQRYSLRASKILSGIDPFEQFAFSNFSMIEATVVEGNEKVQQLADVLGVSPHRIYETYHSFHPVSLDAKRDSGETDYSFHDLLLTPDESEEHSPEHIISLHRLRNAFLTFREGLTPREQHLFDNFMYPGDGDETLDDIGEKYDINTKTLGQEKAQLYQRLRIYLREQRLHVDLPRYNELDGIPPQVAGYSSEELSDRIRRSLGEFGHHLLFEKDGGMELARHVVFRHNVNPYDPRPEAPLRILSKLLSVSRSWLRDTQTKLVIRAEDYLEQQGLPPNFYDFGPKE